MKKKTEEKEKAKVMRRRGYSVNEISKVLKVSKSSVSVWVKEEKLTLEGFSRLSKRSVLGRVKFGDPPRNASWIEKCKEKRIKWREEGKVAASLADPLHVMACSLYWGEGVKSRTDASICNSDVNLLKIFMEFLDRYFGIGPKDVSFRIFSYTDIKSKEEIVDYWTSSLGLLKSEMKKSNFSPQKYKSKGNSASLFAKSAYGTCYISIKKSTRVIQHIYGALEFYSGVQVFKRLY